MLNTNATLTSAQSCAKIEPQSRLEAEVERLNVLISRLHMVVGRAQSIIESIAGPMPVDPSIGDRSSPGPLIARLNSNINEGQRICDLLSSLLDHLDAP